MTANIILLLVLLTFILLAIFILKNDKKNKQISFRRQLESELEGGTIKSRWIASKMIMKELAKNKLEETTINN